MTVQAILDARMRQRTTVLRGEARVSGDPHVELTTVLGSCVATCLYDPAAHVGGMNHFLLAEPISGAGTPDEHYGVYLMEVLINRILAEGAAKQRLRAHLYGGANMHAGMTRIGTVNARFARDFLQREGIVLVREDLGGIIARRVDFRPAIGQVRCRRVENTLVSETRPQPASPRNLGEVELF